MFDKKYLIPREKLTHPHWVLYKSEQDFIGRVGTAPPKNPGAYKAWSDPTVPRPSQFSVFTGEVQYQEVIYWTPAQELLPIDDPRVKNFYLENDAWRAYETICENRFVFSKGVPYCFAYPISAEVALLPNFSNDSGFSYPHPLKLNVSTEPVILLPSYVSGQDRLCGITYGDFIRGLPKVTPLRDKLAVTQGILNNTAFSDEDKASAIRKVWSQADFVPDPMKPLDAKTLKAADAAYKEAWSSEVGYQKETPPTSIGIGALVHSEPIPATCTHEQAIAQQEAAKVKSVFY